MATFFHLDAYPRGVYPGTLGGLVRLSREVEFEVVVGIVRETRVVHVAALHPFRGRWRGTFGEDGKVAGPAHVVEYGERWTIVPDLRDPHAKDSGKRKPAGIGVERLARTDGMMTSTALRAWLKKEA